MTEPFAWGRRMPLILHYLIARLPLVHASRHYGELRMDYIDTARIPGQILAAGIDNALMGGQPYSEWN